MFAPVYGSPFVRDLEGGRRYGSLADFEKFGGVPAKSPAEVGEQANFVFSCVPTAEAVHEVVQGPKGKQASNIQKP